MNVQKKGNKLKVYLWHFLTKQQMVAERRIPVKNAMMTGGCFTVINSISSRSEMEQIVQKLTAVITS